MAVEDFTTYTEVDAGGDITVTATKVEWGGLDRNEESYIYKDFTATHFGDLTHDVEFQLNSGDSDARSASWMITNAINDFYYFWTGNLPGLYSRFIYAGATRNMRIGNLSNNSEDTSIALSESTTYYCTITRVGTTLTSKIYSDSGKTNLLDTISVTCTNTTLRYLYAGSAQNDAVGGHPAAGFSQNFDLNEVGEPLTFEPSDSVSVSDSVIFKHIVAFDDAVSVTDDLTAIKRVLALNDAISISDSPTFKRLLILDDTVNVLDSTIFFHKVALDDAISVSDDVIFKHSVFFSDSIEIEDNASSFLRTGEFVYLSIFDNVNVVDTFAFKRLLTLADAINVSDEAIFKHIFNFSDNINISDTPLFIHKVNLSDTIIVNDSIIVLLFEGNIYVAISDNVAVDDIIIFKHKINLEDAVTISDIAALKRLLYLLSTVNIQDSIRSNNVFQLTGTSFTINLPMPDIAGESGSINNDLLLFDFWLSERDLQTIGINSEPITLSGTIFMYGEDVENEMAVITTKFLNIHTMMDNHEEIAVTGLGSSADAVYIIQNFRYNTIRGSPYAYTWELSLEYVRSI